MFACPIFWYMEDTTLCITRHNNGGESYGEVEFWLRMEPNHPRYSGHRSTCGIHLQGNVVVMDSGIAYPGDWEDLFVHKNNGIWIATEKLMAILNEAIDADGE
jgi:hypothetical protein